MTQSARLSMSGLVSMPVCLCLFEWVCMCVSLLVTVCVCMCVCMCVWNCDSAVQLHVCFTIQNVDFLAENFHFS